MDMKKNDLVETKPDIAKLIELMEKNLDKRIAADKQKPKK